MSDDLTERLNRDAQRAALGMGSDPLRAIADLHRAGVTIYNNTRVMLADFFDRQEGPRPKMIDHAQARRYSEKLDSLKEQLRIGRRLRGFIDQGNTRAEAKARLATMPDTPRGCSPQYGDVCIGYADRLNRWMEYFEGQLPRPGETIAQRRLSLELMFHRFEAAGRPLDDRENWPK